MNETVRRIGALTKQVASAARRLSWNVQRTTPSAIKRYAQERDAAMARESEAYRRMADLEHRRVQGEIEKEIKRGEAL